MRFVVLAFVCPLSRYCGEKIHVRILKVALAKKSTHTLAQARPAPRFGKQYRDEQICLTLR
jgi:hypothetical protein